ncbi:MAG: LapA family protein [Paracoccaceae bacterium]
MRYLRYLILALIGGGLLIVASANRMPVPLQLLPDDLGALAGFNWRIELPLFLVIFGGIVAGLLIGFVWEWLREHKHRATAAEKKREAAQLKREVTRLREEKAGPQDDVLALLEDARHAR